MGTLLLTTLILLIALLLVYTLRRPHSRDQRWGLSDLLGDLLLLVVILGLAGAF